MDKMEIKLKECCLTCEHFYLRTDLLGVCGPCIGSEREISCVHMPVCWKYNTINLDKHIPKKPVNIKKQESKICEAECPACHYSFPDIGGVMESYGEVEEYDYCPECGQKIDWGEKHIS